MDSRSPFLHVFLMAVAALVLFPSLALAITVTGAADVTTGYTGTYTVSGSGAGAYSWTFTDGDPRVERRSSLFIDWLADVDVPNPDESVSVTATVTEDVQNPDSASMEIRVWSEPAIQNPDDVPSIMLPGEKTTNEYGQYLLKSSGGFIGPYDPANYPTDQPYWLFTGPTWPLGIAAGQTRATTFTAPSEGIYAGLYTVTVQVWNRNQQAIQGSDSVNIIVPCEIQPGPLFVMESRNTGSAGAVTYTITGMPDNTTYTVTMWTAASGGQDVTGDPDYGDIVTQAGPSVGGVYTFQYIPPVDADMARSFYIFAEPSDMTVLAPYGPVYYPLPYGPVTVRKSACYGATIVDRTTGLPVPGAKVSLVAPLNYIQNQIADANGEFAFDPLPSGNIYEFWVTADGYIPVSFGKNSFVGCDPTQSTIFIQPSPQASVEGNILAVGGGQPLADDEEVTVAVVHYWEDAGVPQQEFVGELRMTGSHYFLGFETLPQDPPQPGVHDYYLIAYRPGEWVSMVLPAQASGHYTNVNLTLTTDFTTFYGAHTILRVPIVPQGGSFEDNQQDAPVTGGYTVIADNYVYDLVDYTLLDVVPGGWIEMPAGGVLVEKLTGNPVGTNLMGLTDDNPQGSEGRNTFVNGSPSLLFVDLSDREDIDNNLLYKDARGLRMTLPVDLSIVAMGDYAAGNQVLRTTTSVAITDLKGCPAVQIPYSYIRALDFLGDGRTGWATFHSDTGRWFASGGPCVTTETGAEGFTYPYFDRYEIFGCFVDSAREAVGKRAPILAFGALVLALFLGGLWFHRRRRG